MEDFVFITEELHISKHCTIRKYEIGILKKETDDKSLIQFVNIKEPVWVSSHIIERFDPAETGDQYEYKVCNRCNRILPVEFFPKNQNGKNNRTVRRPSCNDCRDLIDGVEVPTKIRRIWEENKPNMVIWECPICKKKTIPGLTSKVVLDHNHQTGMPRAWICDSCNTGLGRFKDDVNVMKQAIKYLKNKKIKRQ